MVSGYRNATLETGLSIEVPHYVNVGDKVSIDTNNKKFIKLIDEN